MDHCSFSSPLAAAPSEKRIAAGGAWVSDAASACLKATALDDQTVGGGGGLWGVIV